MHVYKFVSFPITGLPVTRRTHVSVQSFQTAHPKLFLNEPRLQPRTLPGERARESDEHASENEVKQIHVAPASAKTRTQAAGGLPSTFDKARYGRQWKAM